MSDAVEYVVRRHDGMFVGVIELTEDDLQDYYARSYEWRERFLIPLNQLPAREYLAIQPEMEHIAGEELVYLDPEGYV